MIPIIEIIQNFNFIKKQVSLKYHDLFKTNYSGSRLTVYIPVFIVYPQTLRLQQYT